MRGRTQAATILSSDPGGDGYGRGGKSDWRAQDQAGAPLRALTVRHTIGDLPALTDRDNIGTMSSLIKRQLNHPDALTVVQDCNVVLRDVMMANEDAHDCIPSTEASSSALNVDDDVLTHLPKP
nr:hypothetical protein DM860_003065 [Ipomoea trifida]